MTYDLKQRLALWQPKALPWLTRSVAWLLTPVSTRLVQDMPWSCGASVYTWSFSLDSVSCVRVWF